MKLIKTSDAVDLNSDLTSTEMAIVVAAAMM